MQRRGICPGLAQPMATGDGLLVRLMPTAPIAIDDFVALCAASRDCGNGVIEITQRGSLQIRGLQPATLPGFIETMIGLGLGDAQKPVVLSTPLSGSVEEEALDVRGLATSLRHELAAQSFVGALSPKVSVVVDGGGSLHLDDVSADIRLRANASGRLHVGLGGDATTATRLGYIEARDAVATVSLLLQAMATYAPTARARAMIRSAGIDVFRDTGCRVTIDALPPPARAPAARFRPHLLKTGRLALSVSPAFGHATADALATIAKAAAAAGATAICLTAGRILLLIGVRPDAAGPVLSMAQDRGCIVTADDPRQHVVACAGAPACGSGLLATRELAPVVARAAEPLLDGSVTVHLSGCPKGCAHHGAATLTFTGPDRLAVDLGGGDVATTPFSPRGIADSIGRLAGECVRARRPGESSAAILARFGEAQIGALMSRDQHLNG